MSCNRHDVSFVLVDHRRMEPPEFSGHMLGLGKLIGMSQLEVMGESFPAAEWRSFALQ